MWEFIVVYCIEISELPSSDLKSKVRKKPARSSFAVRCPGLLFHPKDGGRIFLEYVGKLLSDCRRCVPVTAMRTGNQKHQRKLLERLVRVKKEYIFLMEN
jgi:hypothetical protein